MATLGYDGILHGTRNGGSTASPDSLVYNFYNPHAARDNNLQAAADLLALPRAFAGLNTAGIKLDGGHVALYGHSQGGNATALAAARDAGYGAAVMSGTGGTIMLSLPRRPSHSTCLCCCRSCWETRPSTTITRCSTCCRCTSSVLTR